jgi:hypothetical protein
MSPFEITAPEIGAIVIGIIAISFLLTAIRDGLDNVSDRRRGKW